MTPTPISARPGTARTAAADPERCNAVVHYILEGSAGGVGPSPEFDPAWYREFYPDVALADLEPLSHFIHRGKAEGRRPKSWAISIRSIMLSCCV